MPGCKKIIFSLLAFKPPSHKQFENSRCPPMIKVTRLNDSVMVINVEKIQSLQSTPDTVITFTNRDKIMVKEPIEEVSQRIVEYRRKVNCTLGGDIETAPNFE
jgi:flagellar protein FlbD